MVRNVFSLFVGGALCFFVGRMIGHGLAAHHAGVLIALLMGVVWAVYLHVYEREKKSPLHQFMEFFVTSVIGGFIVVALGLG